MYLVCSTLSQSVYNCILTFNFCLQCKGSSLVRSEKLGPSQVFPEHMHCPIHVHSFLLSQKYFWVFQTHLWTPHSPAFPIKLFVSQLFALLHSTSSHHNVLQLPLVFNKCLGAKPFSTVCAESNQIKSALQMWSFKEPTDRSNNRIPWEMSSEGVFTSFCFLQIVFTVTVGYQFSRILQMWGGKPRKKWKLNCTNLGVLTESQLFFLSIPQIAANLWLISRVLKKFWFCFCQCFSAFI